MESLVQKVTKHQQLFCDTKVLKKDTANTYTTTKKTTKKQQKKSDLIYNNSLHGIVILGLCPSTEMLLFTHKLRISLQIFSIHW